MYFFVCGVPGAFAGWCEQVALALARRAGIALELLHAETLDEIALAAVGSGAVDAVVSSHHPGARLCAALLESGHNFVVAFEAPATALIELAVHRGVPLPAAVQRVASSCAALRELAGAAGGLVLRAERDRERSVETAAAIARHLHIAIDEREIAALLAAEPALAAPPHEPDLAAWWGGLDRELQQLSVGALAPFVEDPAEGETLSLTWGRSLFFLGDRPQERISGPIDITGRARCLLHGPDIVLPYGYWSLDLRARLTGAAVEHEFIVEVCSDQPLASGVLRPDDEGEAELRLEFALDQTGDLPLSLRISTQRAAFDGAIAIEEVILVRAAPAAAKPGAADWILVQA